MYRCDPCGRGRAAPLPCRGRRTTTAAFVAIVMSAGASLLTACASSSSSDQISRNFPQNALRGTVAVLNANDIVLNGRPARLAPGARIRNADNMLEMSGALIGREFVANYTVENDGLVRDVWILRNEERARRPWPVSMDQARAWQFDPTAQTWTRP
jgi:hypothetical protein